MNFEEHQTTHIIARDLFLFACYAGTAYVDAVAITQENLSKNDAGNLWLKYKRGKNGSLSRVKLLHEAIELIEKYKDPSRKTLFLYMDYQALKYRLYSIRELAGFKGALSYHMGRHSFSTLITLEGVPIVVERDKIICDYYGLEMVVVISFQVQSIKAKQFREYILQRLVAPLNCQKLELHDWRNIHLKLIG